jgi:HEXXH motif-containing protein
MREMFDAFYPGYSNALESFPTDFHLRWTGELQRERVRAFLRHRAAELRRVDPALETMVQAGLANVSADPAAAFEQLWRPEISLLSLDRTPAGASPAAGRGAALALHWATCGSEGEWQAELDPPIGLRFDRWWIDAVRRVRLRAAGGDVSLAATLAGGERISLAWRRSEDGRWDLVEGAWPSGLELDWQGARILLLPLKRGQADRDADVIAPEPAMLGHIEAALRLIEASSPAFTEWVARMLRIIVPWRATEGLFRNASNPNCCGCVMMTVHADTARIAETFVHEISHHYFDVLESMADLVNGRDPREYWSPPRREMRPLRAILVAHHAFMNCLLYYQLQEAAGLRLPSDFGRTFEQLVDWQHQMEDHLAGSDGLTPVGEMLWRRLAARIAFIDRAIAA